MPLTTLELLPNEILFQCFQYLNIIHIFHSFDQLNHRFNRLIRNISFHLNFQNVPSKFQCEQFCQKLSIEQTIKTQLHSLYLSNKSTCYPAHLFLSKCSLTDFPNLRSLTFHHTTQVNWKRICSTLPLLSELSCLQMIDSFMGDSFITDNMMSLLATMSQIQILKLTFRNYQQWASNIHFPSLVYLSINRCYSTDLFSTLTNALKLKYFRIEEVPYTTSPPTPVNLTNPAINLQILHIDSFEGEIDHLFQLLERTPNLENLLILNCCRPNIINVDRWKDLMIFSLRHLKKFQFIFSIDYAHRSENDEQILKRFQNSFPYTEYIMTRVHVTIYTIPYPSKSFMIRLDRDRHYNDMVNYMNTFDYVKYLTIEPVILEEKNQYHFSNVDSLSLARTCSLFRDHPLKVKYSDFRCLQMTVNLANIKHLSLSQDFKFETSDIFVEIFKSARDLTSLSVYLDDLGHWIEDGELCKYFNKCIRKLEFFVFNWFQNSIQLEQFCNIFNNLEQLYCTVNELETLFLIKYLPRLTYLQIDVFYKNYQISSIGNELEKLGLDIVGSFDAEYNPRLLFIWINRN
ncbi:unnamed protein product [Adineta ricciae]|uniref:F-box domain-containing protein n=1 Tax=Adineta ricciae TaxID=249248 RepID=A0A815ET77_ADIRI|nr:unnamed protein product [Adineta ricciae]CAF1509108.1 unnamed protein product [Adineta ricciae]